MPYILLAHIILHVSYTTATVQPNPSVNRFYNLTGETRNVNVLCDPPSQRNRLLVRTSLPSPFLPDQLAILFSPRLLEYRLCGAKCSTAVTFLGLRSSIRQKRSDFYPRLHCPLCSLAGMDSIPVSLPSARSQAVVTHTLQSYTVEYACLRRGSF